MESLSLPYNLNDRMFLELLGIRPTSTVRARSEYCNSIRPTKFFLFEVKINCCVRVRILVHYVGFDKFHLDLMGRRVSFF